MKNPQKQTMIFSPFIVMVLATLLFSTQSPRVVCSEPTVYDLLRHFQLPEGLFPKGVGLFDYYPSGKFEVYLDHPCNSQYENELHFDRNISGVISVGKIDEIKGISAKDLFLWFPVKEIEVEVPSTGVIYFDIGVASKQFSLSSFDTPKDCMAVQSLPHAAHQISYGSTIYQLDHKDLGRAIL